MQRQVRFSGFCGGPPKFIDGETWFSVADDYTSNETVWYEVRCARGSDVAALAAREVGKGVLVAVAGLAEDRGYKTKLGKWKSKWILWVSYLSCPSGERAGDPQAKPEHAPNRNGTTAVATEPTPEEELLRHKKHLEECPLRWKTERFWRSDGGRSWMSEHPEYVLEYDEKENDTSPVPLEQLTEFIRGFLK